MKFIHSFTHWFTHSPLLCRTCCPGWRAPDRWQEGLWSVCPEWAQASMTAPPAGLEVQDRKKCELGHRQTEKIDRQTDGLYLGPLVGGAAWGRQCWQLMWSGQSHWGWPHPFHRVSERPWLVIPGSGPLPRHMHAHTHTFLHTKVKLFLAQSKNCVFLFPSLSFLGFYFCLFGLHHKLVQNETNYPGGLNDLSSINNKNIHNILQHHTQI